MSTFQDLQDKVDAMLLRKQDEIVINVVNNTFENPEFHTRASCFLLSQVTDGDELADNAVQELEQFLIRELT